MRQAAAVRCSRCTCPSCEAEREQLAQLVFEMADLRAERPADRGAWAPMAEASDGQWFTAAQMVRRAEVDGAVYDALLEAGAEDARELACWLREHRDREIDGVALIRGRRISDGYLWRFASQKPVGEDAPTR